MAYIVLFLSLSCLINSLKPTHLLKQIILQNSLTSVRRSRYPIITFKMHYSTFLLAALPVVFAQYGDSQSGSSSSSSGSTPSSTASATNGIQTVLVGSPNTLSITPNNIKAAVGTVVEFVFYPKTHSVAQSSFAEPCAPLANGTGFFSGGQTTSSGANPTVYAITVNDTKPIWFYCAFPGHCQNGMVGVINAP